ncbi:MAG: peptide ABC transporter substrate-binding protein [Dehalococcoidia bacterium]
MHRQSRSRLLYLAVLAGGLLLLTAGWYVASNRMAAGGGRYIEGVVGAPRYPTPLFARDNAVDGDLAALLFAGLTRIDADGTPRPDLAERWEVTPDGLTYTFYLRPDLRWHDGAPLTSADAAFTVATVQAPGFQGAATLAARWASVIVIVPDERTVVFRLPQPSASFLTVASLGLVPKHLLDGLGAADLLTAPANRATVGSGPFRLAALDESHAVLEPYAAYHLGPPRLARLELRFYADEAALARAIAGRQVSAALLDETPSPEALRAVAARSDLRTTPLVEGAYDILYLNNQREPLTDTALRRALAASIDRPALIPQDSPALPGDGVIVPGSWAYEAGGWSTPAQADALFIAAGWRREGSGPLQRDGKPLRLDLLTNDDARRVALAQAIAGQLRTHGVEVSVRVLSPSDLLRDHISPRAYDLLLFGWQTDIDPDPFGGWHTSQAASGGRNVAGFHDEAADRLLEQARRTLDGTERRDLYRQFQVRFVDLAPAVVVEYPRRLYVQPQALQGAAPGVLFEPASRFQRVEQWVVGR